MKLVLLSSNYPFGNMGDNCFIQNEIYSLAEEFDELIVISTGKGILRNDVPENLKAINCNIKKNFIFNIFISLFSIFTKRFHDASKELKQFYPNIRKKESVKQILKYEFMYNLLKKTVINESKDADLIYSYWLSSRAYAVARLKENKRINCPFISRCHGFDCYLRDSSKLPYRNYIIGNLSELIFISDKGKQYYRRNIVPAIKNDCKMITRYLGVNKEPEIIKYKGSKVLRIVSCSSIIQIKRIDILINALSFIDDFEIEWKHFGDGELYPYISGLANQKLHSKNNINYSFMGNYSNYDLMNYYRTHEIDLFINTSDNEGIPVSIMECYSFGIPAIARDVGGMSEIICENNEGYLLKSQADGKEFSEALRLFYNLSTDEKLMKREEVLNIFSEKFSKKSIQLFSEEIKKIL